MFQLQSWHQKVTTPKAWHLYGLLVFVVTSFSQILIWKKPLWPSPFTSFTMKMGDLIFKNPWHSARVNGVMFNLEHGFAGQHGISQDSLNSQSSATSRQQSGHFKHLNMLIILSGLHPRAIFGEFQHISMVCQHLWYQKNSPFGRHWSSSNSANHRATIYKPSKNTNWYIPSSIWLKSNVLHSWLALAVG